MLQLSQTPLRDFVVQYRTQLWLFVAISLVELAIQAVWHPLDHVINWELITVRSLLH